MSSSEVQFRGSPASAEADHVIDRMLVRVSYTEAVSVPADFDESQDRVDPHIQSDNWMEYIVAWRKDRLELYRDHVGLYYFVT